MVGTQKKIYKFAENYHGNESGRNANILWVYELFGFEILEFFVGKFNSFFVRSGRTH